MVAAWLRLTAQFQRRSARKTGKLSAKLRVPSDSETIRQKNRVATFSNLSGFTFRPEMADAVASKLA
jgi:hypothetical protein